MSFRSILFKEVDKLPKEEHLLPPPFFVDLNLDQVVESITAGKKEYDLKPFFYIPLHDMDEIEYRHEIFHDLENKVLFEVIKSFARCFQKMRDHLATANKLYYKLQKEAWFLDAVESYCKALLDLAQGLSQLELKSRGFLEFREYLANYVSSTPFNQLLSETGQIKSSLATVKYTLFIVENTIKVGKYEPQRDYSEEVNRTFEKFKQGAAKNYLVDFPNRMSMNHIEERILEIVTSLYPEIFSRLEQFYIQNENYLDPIIAAFDREVQFYIAYIEYVERFTQTGLKFCYPKISNSSKEVFDDEGFDLALAHQFLVGDSTVVCNDFHLNGKERILVVSGPNQGGKTTFARTFGQLHFMACLGCLVPGRKAQLFLFDKLFTHFENEENIKNLRGKLQDDLVRIYEILKEATPNSIIIMNEIFTSTTLKDAIYLSKKIMERIVELDLLCVCVTFLDEISKFGETTVSMVSTVAPENPAMRTYKIVRKPADGISHAISIVEKYHLTFDNLQERLNL